MDRQRQSPLNPAPAAPHSRRDEKFHFARTDKLFPAQKIAQSPLYIRSRRTAVESDIGVNRSIRGITESGQLHARGEVTYRGEAPGDTDHARGRVSDRVEGRDGEVDRVEVRAAWVTVSVGAGEGGDGPGQASATVADTVLRFALLVMLTVRPQSGALLDRLPYCSRQSSFCDPEL